MSMHHAHCHWKCLFSFSRKYVVWLTSVQWTVTCFVLSFVKLCAAFVYISFVFRPASISGSSDSDTSTCPHLQLTVTVTCNHFRFRRLRFEFGSASWTCTCPFDFWSGNFKITKTALVYSCFLFWTFCVSLWSFCVSLCSCMVSVFQNLNRFDTFFSCTLLWCADGTGNEVVIHSPASQPARPKIEMRNGIDWPQGDHHD